MGSVGDYCIVSRGILMEQIETNTIENVDVKILEVAFEVTF